MLSVGQHVEVFECGTTARDVTIGVASVKSAPRVFPVGSSRAVTFMLAGSWFVWIQDPCRSDPFAVTRLSDNFELNPNMSTIVCCQTDQVIIHDQPRKGFIL
ncbi:hypothetical protein PHYPO_G00186570 [Pangasianodon hypophthalmus]|uniref:Uncharacterized protein n=1 Tax=Pangasianodon hypophthalmus TaxID=310915 RepID=A0A5N5JH90_PANHP|nr:hypothetical protein PHYPO_G00186570 [Pangasianodon hypophthalmus]